MAPVLKTGVPERVPWVRIPLSPQKNNRVRSLDPIIFLWKGFGKKPPVPTYKPACYIIDEVLLRGHRAAGKSHSLLFLLKGQLIFGAGAFPIFLKKAFACEGVDRVDRGSARNLR